MKFIVKYMRPGNSMMPGRESLDLFFHVLVINASSAVESRGWLMRLTDYIKPFLTLFTNWLGLITITVQLMDSYMNVSSSKAT